MRRRALIIPDRALALCCQTALKLALDPHRAAGDPVDTMNAAVQSRMESTTVLRGGGAATSRGDRRMGPPTLFVLPSRIGQDGDRDGLPCVWMEAASQKLPNAQHAQCQPSPNLHQQAVTGILSDERPRRLGRCDDGVSPMTCAWPATGRRSPRSACTPKFTMAPGICQLHKTADRKCWQHGRLMQLASTLPFE